MLAFAQIALYFVVFIFGVVAASMVNVALYVQFNTVDVKKIRTVTVSMICKDFNIMYTVVAVLGGLLALACFVLGCSNGKSMIEMLILFAFLCLLMAVSAVDIFKMEIPNGYVISILVIAIGSLLMSFFCDGKGEITVLDGLIGFFSVSVPLLLIALLIKGAFGGGDIKLMAACGLFLGWKLILVSAFLGIILGGLYGAFLLIFKKKSKDSKFAFGPCLCIGMTLCCFFGNQIIDKMFYLLDFSRLFM